jgi:hypothetical protein
MLLNHALLTHVPTNLDELEVVVRHASAQCGLMEREQKHVTPELNSKSFSENGGMPKAGMKELLCQNKFENCCENTCERNATNGLNKFWQNLHPSIACMMFNGNLFVAKHR